MISLILSALLAASDPAMVEPSAMKTSDKTETLAALPASDLDIQRALWAAYQSNPEKNVCVTRTLTGSHQPRQVCGTLQRWFAARTPDEVSRKEPPSPLVEGIKEERRKAMARARGNKKAARGG